jgi:hypothetical protein
MTTFSYYFEHTIDSILSFSYYLKRLKAAVRSWFYWVINYDNPNWPIYVIRNHNWSYKNKSGIQYYNFWTIINEGKTDMLEEHFQNNFCD